MNVINVFQTLTGTLLVHRYVFLLAFSSFKTAVTVDTCHSKPCLNNGTCSLDSRGNYYCICGRRYYGESCQIDHCSCGVHGKCVDDPLYNQGYRCDCDANYSGSRCTEFVVRCSHEPCQNGGTCIDHPWGSDCQCSSRYEGFNCQHDVCSCGSHGTCQNDPSSGYRCHCDYGYTGRYCTLEGSTDCSSSPCQNSGNCTSHSPGSYSCACSPRYYGDNCENDRCACGTHGVCEIDFSKTPSYTCRCDPGYTGTPCEIHAATDYICSSHPCQHGGVCTQHNNLSYSCNCTSRYYGSNCQNDRCSCGTHGTCMTNLTRTHNYKCLCDSGYTGPTCNISHTNVSAGRVVGDILTILVFIFVMNISRRPSV